MRFCCKLLFLLALNGSLWAFQTIELKNGAALRGEVLAERSGSYYVDLGFDLIQVPKEAVASILDAKKIADQKTPVMPNEEALYQVSASTDDRSIRDWIDDLGEAVALVQTPTGLGSGFVIHKDGYVVTNHHVISGEHRISITIFKQSERELNKVTYDKVRIVATSAEMDLALLKIDGEVTEPFKIVSLAAADQGLREGQSVFAIGSPLGLDRTVSEGIISVANRVIGGRLYLQTTTQINPGNSGGPLFNLNGAVVGVNNMKIAAVGAEGLGFSISSRTLKSFLDNLDAYAFDPRNPNSGFRYLDPPSISRTGELRPDAPNSQP
ncbi:MAG: S1C family serine protease [Opitutales bacterium]